VKESICVSIEHYEDGDGDGADGEGLDFIMHSVPTV